MELSIPNVSNPVDGHDGLLDHDTIMMAPDAREAGEEHMAGRRLDLEKAWWRCRSRENTVLDTQPVGRTKYYATQRNYVGMHALLVLLFASIWIAPVSAAFIEFQNCLSESVQNNMPLQLQIVPQYVNAVFDTVHPNHTLNVTVWGNVTGSAVGPVRYNLPAINDTTYWNNLNQTSQGGKILEVPYPDGADEITTLFNKVAFLTYEPFDNNANFCGGLVNGSCPLGPSFNATASVPYDLPSFGFSNNFYSTYAFTSLTATLLVKYGDNDSTPISCVSAVITPDLGVSLSSMIKYVPVVVLVSVGFATAFAAIWSPWGTSDVFRWTTNYGRDADLLRLVTPGFGDCLQYIQFVALTGGLTLNYPGFYQPIVSKVSWSALMFNQSFVSNTNSQSLQDGIYVTKGIYGLDRLTQLIGMGSVDDVWAGMVIWLLVILAAAFAIIQIWFFLRWVYRHVNNTQEEDLRAKNMPFTVGNVIRIVFNYFLLPIVALSTFQLVVAGQSPAFTVGLAVVMLVLILAFAGWLFWVIVSTRPKSFLFDDLPTVLLYGALYDTYSDDAAPFALVPMFLTFVRGVAIGAVQPSGIAQLVLLAICEVITVLTLHAFRPFHSPTSMNAFHTFFAVFRFTSVLLMISFAPSLGVTEGPKGWIGYAILLLHAVVLILGFFLNAIQTIIEVVARMAGAGGDGGTARGGLVKVFGMRQLSRRLPRHAHSRQSQLSSTAMLDAELDRKSYIMDSGRIRSQSAGSTGILLNRQSIGMDTISVDAFGALPSHQVVGMQGSQTPTTPGEASTFSFVPSAAAPSSLVGRNRQQIAALAAAEATDPYYRPPRMRRPTLEAYSPGAMSRGSWASGNWGQKSSDPPESSSPQENVDEGPSISGRVTPVAMASNALDGSPQDIRRSNVDYTRREVDFYYGVRGPALNDKQPGRRVKTGPADPTGPAASAAGWFKGLFGGKTKEKGKGFEVVRSSRMPPGMNAGAKTGPGEPLPPEGIPVATGGVRHGPIDSDDEDIPARRSADSGLKPTAPSMRENENLVSPMGSHNGESSDEDFENVRISDIPPNLSGLDIPEGGIELPSRFPSKATSRGSSQRQPYTDAPPVPDITRMPSIKPSVPRKSSRRKSLSVDLTDIAAGGQRKHTPQASLHLPFDRNDSKGSRSDISSRGTADISGGHSRAGSSTLDNLSGDAGVERHTSMGYVHQHMARTVSQSENPHYLGTSAELVDAGQLSGSSSMETIPHDA